MQIGDVNVHRCAMVLDEVFGPENRVSTIMYATGGGGASTRSVPKAGDCILWYASDADALKFQQLYEEQDIEAWCNTQTFAGGADLPDGSSRALKTEERRDPKRTLPEGTKLWTMGRLNSQGGSDNERGKPFTYDGVQYGPEGLENDQWRIDQHGLEHLAEIGRLWSNVKSGIKTASAHQLRMKIYREEMPGRRISNHWGKTISPSDKRYAVQTGDLAITRCILMTTNPGGAGTTALVAERWGRRWISIDSSRESIAVTRERVLVHDYPRHLLIGSEEGFKEEQRRRAAAGQEPLATKPEGANDPASGFVVDRMPYVSAATLAYAERPDKRAKRDVTWLVDRTAGPRAGRVCSRFTVETELMEIYQAPGETVRPSQARRDVGWQEQIAGKLEQTGVRSDGGQHWDVEGLESIIDDAANGKTPGALSHTAKVVDRQTGRKVDAAIAIWPEDAKVDIAAIHRNVSEVQRRGAQGILVVVGAEFADGTEPGPRGHGWAIDIARVRAGQDLHLTKVTDKGKSAMLVLVAEPAVKIEAAGEGILTCTIHGWNEFNPVTGTPHWRPQSDIQMWMLDTDYDQTEFCARRIHLPRRLRKAENRKTLEKLLGRDGSPEALNAAFGWTSHPFPPPARGQIAVRVVTASGGMMSWSGPATAEQPSQQQRRKNGGERGRRHQHRGSA